MCVCDCLGVCVCVTLQTDHITDYNTVEFHHCCVDVKLLMYVLQCGNIFFCREFVGFFWSVFTH